MSSFGAGDTRYSTLSSANSNNSSSVDVDEELELLDRLDSLPLDDGGVASIHHSGWLKKEGSRVKSWKRRERGQGLRSQNSAFGANCENSDSSFIECEPELNEKPAAKPWSPKAPGTNTIMQMRLEDKLLLEELEEERQEALAKEALLSTATQQKKKKQQQEDETTSSGPCTPCCSVM